MFLEDDVLSYFQVPKFWKTVQQNFFEIDFKKVRIFLKILEIEKFRKSWISIENFRKSKIFEILIFEKISIEIQLFWKFSISNFFRPQKYSKLFFFDQV